MDKYDELKILEILILFKNKLEEFQYEINFLKKKIKQIINNQKNYYKDAFGLPVYSLH